MSIVTNYPFLIPGNYTFNSTEIEVSAGCRLVLQQGNVAFTEDFADDTGFTYDSDDAEFSGGQVQQKLQKPTNSLLYAKWDVNENADYAYESITGTLNGAAAISGGKLVCAGEAIGHLDFSNSNQGDGNKGTVKFKWTPKFSGAPATEKIIYWNGNIASYNGAILLLLVSTSLYFYIYNSAGGTVLNKSVSFTPVADTQYEIVMTWDFTGADDSNFFIDGVLKDGGNIVSTRGTTTTNRLGNDGTGTKLANHEYDDLVIYDSVIYTANYTPGYTLPYPYKTTCVILPEMEHIGDGNIKLFNSFTTTEAGAPRYIVQIGRSGDYLYWTGSAWAVSNETYAQANDAATFNTNCGSLPVDGEDYGQFAIIFPDSNTLSSVDELTANMNVDTGYLTTNPTILINTTFRHEDLDGFEETSNKTGSDEIKYILKKGTSWYWWTGSAWAVSDGTYAQSNTAAEIYANRATFTTEIVVTQIKIFLHSADGSTTPEITNLEVQYNFAGETPDTINTCIVWGVASTMTGAPLTDTITVSLNKESVQYKTDTVIRSETITITPDSVTGYWEVELVETENMETAARYIFDFGGDRYERQVPNEDDKKFWELVA